MQNKQNEADVNDSRLRLIPACVGMFRFYKEAWSAVYASEALCRLLGLKGDALAAQFLAEPPALLHPEDADDFSLLVYKAGISGGYFQQTARVRTADGSYRWMEIHLNAEVQAGGTVLLCLLLYDVQARMDYYQKLDRTYTQLLDVMDNAPGGIVAFDTVNNRRLLPTFVSQGMGRLLGGTREEIVAAYKANPYGAIHPEDRGNVVHTVEDALRNLSGFQLTMRLKTIPGAYVWVSANATVDTLENRRTLYMAFADISTNAEDVRVQKQILNVFVQHQYENLCLIDGKNGSYKAMTSIRYTAPFLTENGNNFDDAMAAMIRAYAFPPEKEQMLAHMRIKSILEELQTKGELEYFCTVVPPGRKPRYKRLWLSWLDKETKMIALVGSDVTEEHERQEESRAALISALKAAEASSAAKSEFLSRMSHDIRTPLNAIIGYIEMCLEQTSAVPEIHGYLTKAESSSRFLLSLINDILNMSRIESGKLVLKESVFSIRPFFDGISSVAASQCVAKQIRYACRVAENVAPAYWGDTVKLQQILQNIVGNAVKFTPEQGSVTLEAEELPGSDPAILRFCVRDTGCGISKEFLPHLFDAFAQEKHTLDSEIKGTGLGLAICKSLVEMMRGKISVESQVGVGSAFTILLPLRRADGQTGGGNYPCSTNQAAIGPQNFMGSRVLLAEDNRMNTEIATHILQKANLRVDTAQNGEEACRLFADSPEGTYRAVLMDIRMPVMDGLEATRKIRAMQRADSAVPIIALSANAFEEDVREALQSGMNAYTAKPIDVRQLYETLHRFIG